MLNPIRIEGTNETPRIILDQENGIFEITGKSLPENVNIVYNPVLQWFREYMKAPNPETHIVLKFDYYNSGTTRKIVDILLTIEDMDGINHNISITWYNKKDDDVMISKGIELKNFLKIPVEIKLF